MNENEFLEKARLHKDYKNLLEYKSAEELDLAILRIRNSYDITEQNYEYKFYVDAESITNENPHLEDFLKDISEVFEKYKDKGIVEGDLDRRGSTYPATLNIVVYTLKQKSYKHGNIYVKDRSDMPECRNAPTHPSPPPPRVIREG